MVCVSTMLRNSLLIGSGASLAMILRLSISGRPALMPRTITSTHRETLRESLLLAPLLEKREHPERQADPAVKPAATAGMSPAPIRYVSDEAKHAEGASDDQEALF